MRKTLFFTFLLFSEILFAQSTGQTIVAKQIHGSGFQFINAKTNSPVNPLTWDEAELFVNGYARVLRDNKFTFVDSKGQPVCAAQFDGARNFSNRLAAVRKDTKWGFINESGKTIIPFQYEIVFDFNEAVTGVFANGKWLLINTSGEIVKQLDIAVFYGFNNGIARIEKDGKKGTMNSMGQVTLTNQPVATPVFSKQHYSRSASDTAQCPDNIDFEYGSFNNWKCFLGRVDSIGSTNVITVNPSPPTPNRHTLYSRTMPSPLDPYGLFPTNPPDGSNFAVRLGNTNIGAQAERIQYPIHVPLNDSNFSIRYDYAVVFEDPGHTIWTQPRFTVRLFDSALNTYVDCASFEYISTSVLPGFAHSTIDTAVMFKPWSSVFVSLRGYAGKTMFLEFTTADCVRRGHWGYAYLDVEKPCGQSAEIQYQCTSPNNTTFDGPPGFQTYNWWDSSFTILYGTGQHVTLNPGPPLNTTVWLEMIPFYNFGCKDTIPVKVKGTFDANFSVSDTVGICAPHTFTFYNSNVPSASAIWDFGDGTTGTGDTVSHTYTLPGNYTVTLTTTLPSGCTGTVQKNISVIQPTGNFSFTGTYFCNNQQVRFDAVVNNADSLFWDFGDGTHLATTQTTVYHSYAQAGVYMPYLTVQSSLGCRNTLPGPDTIKIEKLNAGFSFTQQKICGSTTLQFTDTSYSYFGIGTDVWDFGDGITGSGHIVNHTYFSSGTYNVQLIITGISGCKDTIVKPIYIKVNTPPVASITAVSTQCQATPVTFTSSVQSVDTINLIHWTSSNGSTGTGNTFTVNFAAAGTFNVQLIVGTVNGCFDTTNHSITINPTPNVVQPSNQVLCSGASTAAINFTGSVAGTVYTWTNDNTSIGLAAGGTGNIPSFTAVNNTSAPIVATITVSPSAAGCPGTSKTFTITVNPTATVAQPNNQVLCRNSLTAAINFSGTVSGTVFNWTNSNTAIGLAANGTGDIPSFTAINNSNSVVVATISVTPIANGCPGQTKTFTITINPAADVNQPADQLLCNGSSTNAINFTGSVTGTSYSWTNSNTTIGLAATGVGNIPSFIATNDGNTSITATITVSAIANNCPGTDQTFTITVYPTPAVVKPADQSLCNGTASSPINFSGLVTGTTFNWVNDNPSIGLAASGTGNISTFTAVNNTNTAITATITITPLSNGCPGTQETFTITVNPNAVVLKPADQVLCNGSSSTAINFAGPVSGTIFNWTNNNTTIGLAASGAGNIPVFTATNNTNATITATIIVSSMANGCPGNTETFTITVDPTPAVVQPNDQAKCNGTATDAIIFSGSVAGTIYTWVNDMPSIGLAATGTGDIPSFIAVNNSNTPVIATITVSSSANGCQGGSKTFRITVNPTPGMTQPGNQVLCANDLTGAIVFSGTVAGSVYNWANNNITVGLAANGLGNIPSFNAINNTTQPVTSTITVSANANGCASPASVLTITVNPRPSVEQPVNQEYCHNASTSAIAFTSAVNGASFSWTNSNPYIGLPASGTGNIPAFTAANNTGSIITATITVSASANGCFGDPKTFTITVNPSPAMVQPGSQVLCNGSTTAPVNFSGMVSGTIFNWTNSEPSIGLAASGSGDIPAFTAINNSNVTVTATITITATANGCPGQTRTFTITVTPTAEITQPQDLVFCNGSTSPAIIFGTAVNGTTLTWTNDNTAIGLNPAGIGNIPAFTVMNSTVNPITANITVSPTAGSCPGPTKTFSITVNPTPNVDRPTDQLLCTGKLTTKIIFEGLVPGTVYTWTNDNPSIGLAATGSGNILAFTAVNNSNAMATATITVTPMANNCPGPSQSSMIVVKPAPKVLQPSGQSLCNGAITSAIGFSATQPGSVFNWTNNNPSIGLAATGTGNIDSFIVINNTSNPVTALINVAASANGCTGPANAVAITVNPTPAVVATGNTHVCLGKPIQLSVSGAAQYSWSPANLLSCTNCSNPVSTPADSIQYLVKGTSAFGCVAYDSVLVNVIKPFQMRVIPNDTLCVGESTGLKAMQANTYLWSPATGLNNVNIAEPTATPLQTTTYQVVGYDGYHCFTDTGHVTVTVGPKPSVEIGPDISTQTGTTVTLNPVFQNGPIVTWSWTPATDLSCTDCPTPIASVKSNTEYTVTVTNRYGCRATDRININVFCHTAQVYIPNAFTPDGDGMNDILMIRGNGISVKMFRIFSRWGELVFERTNFSPNDPKYGWDGKIRGVPASPDVFVYTAEVVCDNGYVYVYKGNTTILK